MSTSTAFWTPGVALVAGAVLGVGVGLTLARPLPTLHNMQHIKHCIITSIRTLCIKHYITRTLCVYSVLCSALLLIYTQVSAGHGPTRRGADCHVSRIWEIYVLDSCINIL